MQKCICVVEATVRLHKSQIVQLVLNSLLEVQEWKESRIIVKTYRLCSHFERQGTAGANQQSVIASVSLHIQKNNTYYYCQNRKSSNLHDFGLTTCDGVMALQLVLVTFL